MKRKTLTLVLCLLATFALASIGFASWIIANPSDVNITEEGSFTVYEATDTTAAINWSFVSGKNRIIFGKPTSDQLGQVTGTPWLTYDDSDDSMAEENLSVSVSVSQTNESYNGTIEVYLYVDASTYTVLQTAKTNKLIDFNDSQFVELTIGSTKYYGMKVELSGQTPSILTLTFSWGEKFKGKNPYVHYNSGSYDDTAAATLNSLKPLNSLEFNLLIQEKAA